MRSIVPAVAALLALVAGPSSADEKQQPISDAEKLLFQSNHLTHVGPHHRLRYGFKKAGSLEAGFGDSVEVDVVGEDGAGKAVDVRFLPVQSAAQGGALNPSMPHVEGNPVLLLFLDRQIHEMARLTGGRPDYFQRRIRMALADHAQISDTRITVGGHSHAAKQIAISPYLDDPNRSHFEKFAAESYVFVLGDDVPGSIYSLQAHLAAPDGEAKSAAAPLLDETLTFDAEQPIK